MDTEKIASSQKPSQDRAQSGSESLENAVHEVGSQDPSPYPQGARFWLITLGMTIALFLTNLEIPIVTTSVVGITNDLGGFDKAGWLISSYLLGYVAVVVNFAKLSDIFGRKPLLATAIGFFIVASAACGGAQTIVQLIVFRAFQGIGGGGCNALGVTMITDLVPPGKWAAFGTYIALVYAISLLAGPIMGGAISERTSWRWVFLINIPCAVPALLFTLFAIPRGFPRHNSPDYVSRTFRSLLVKDAYTRIDFLGGFLLLAATSTITAGFHEADSAFPWKSAFVITILTVSGILWIALILWERRVTLRDSVMEPVLPWVFLTDRVILGLLLRYVVRRCVYPPAKVPVGTQHIRPLSRDPDYALHNRSPLWRCMGIDNDRKIQGSPDIHTLHLGSFTDSRFFALSNITKDRSSSCKDVWLSNHCRIWMRNHDFFASYRHAIHNTRQASRYVQTLFQWP
ncbi:MFS general substrate transporter [Bimuria novae-zelandiae CBS 107.79]|uniref:MFS general substrate transporter n=1 Tax=Bimuria novae-zelandiae CBS 107.79 TaxID=1447943 RepID=A0A6A5VKJ0_9PLEO|nr:MFS general substrate transporter [Bimuria novae-zelandiae CBS 107.79]